MESAVAPNVVAPDDLAATTDPARCTATVAVAPFTVTGIPEPMVSITTDPEGPTITQMTSSAVFSLGETKVTALATNEVGTASDSYTVRVTDNEAPVVGTVADVRENAMTANGAVVTFTLPTVTDNCPGAIVSSTPASGSLFVIGDTAVTVTGNDSSGNTAQATFTVHVAGAAEQLAALRLAVEGVGPGHALADKVNRAAAYLAAGDQAAAAVQLTGFIALVRAQKGRMISPPVAVYLIAEARRIRAVLTC
jgi:hypothetical protein